VQLREVLLLCEHTLLTLLTPGRAFTRARQSDEAWRLQGATGSAARRGLRTCS
jgi:hypothetical protein